MIISLSLLVDSYLVQHILFTFHPVITGWLLYISPGSTMPWGGNDYRLRFFGSYLAHIPPTTHHASTVCNIIAWHALFYHRSVGHWFTLYAWPHGGPRLDQDVQRRDTSRVHVCDTKPGFHTAKHCSYFWGFASGQGSSRVCPITQSALLKWPVTLDLFSEFARRKKT